MKLLILIGFMVCLLMTPATVPASDTSEKDHICFMRVDKDGNGMMSFQEFIPFYGKDREKFDQMDEDKDGNVSHDEYEAFLYHGE